jgi:hypothetical protein
MTTVQKIQETPMAPYIGLMQGMSHKQKRVVIAFLSDSMKEPDKTEEKMMLKPNPFRNFRRANDITEEERTRIMEGIRSMPVSSETEQLIDGLSLTETEMQDERTKYILGLEK